MSGRRGIKERIQDQREDEETKGQRETEADYPLAPQHVLISFTKAGFGQGEGKIDSPEPVVLYDF
jgi:hypothetical protein